MCKRYDNQKIIEFHIYYVWSEPFLIKFWPFFVWEVGKNLAIFCMRGKIWSFLIEEGECLGKFVCEQQNSSHLFMRGQNQKHDK